LPQGTLVFMTWYTLDIDAEVARMTIRVLLYLLLTLVGFVVLSVLAGIFSWLDYRKEEVILLNQVVRS
jgi:nucleoside recognition membrane protein YjiH